MASKASNTHIDEERAPLIRLAFELYTEPDANLNSVLEQLTTRGLTSRPTPSRPAAPITVSTLQRLLRDPTYIGYVEHKDQLYPGRHQPLVSNELYDKVQDLIRSRSKARERRRTHHHLLKGSIYCGDCFHRDRTIQQLVLTYVKNRHGDEYLYYFCPESKTDRGRSAPPNTATPCA